MQKDGAEGGRRTECLNAGAHGEGAARNKARREQTAHRARLTSLWESDAGGQLEATAGTQAEAVRDSDQST